MRSQANSVKGQGVGSAYDEQVSLIKNYLSDKYIVTENDRVKSDIVHFHTINPQYYLSLPFVKRNSVAVGYVHFLPETVDQSLQLPKFARAVFYKYMLSFYKKMDYLVTVNPYFIDRLEHYGIDRSKVYYIPNFVNEKDFYPLDESDKIRLKKKYGIRPECFTVVCAGQLQTRKGIFDFAECAKRMPDVNFVWAGGFSFGKITDGYDEVKKLLDDHPENMKFTGILDRSEMNEIYNLGDVMFLASFEELFPMTILEAMNCKKPILLRDIPIYENILFDFYLKAASVDGFTEQINKLKNDKEYYAKAEEMSWKGHLFYNRENILSMWDNFYTEIITKRLPERFKQA